MTIRELIENKSTLDYQQICTSLIQTFRVDEKVNWESVLPAQQQQEYFGGETLRLIAEHPILSKQKDIRPISLKKGSISQMLFFYVCLQDSSLPKKQIQDVTKKFISGGDANRYIIWFFGNREGTALKVVLSAKEGKKIVLKTLPFGVAQPYYKTYDFIIREVNEKVNQLFVEPTDLWKALWTAFDISVINRKFYEEIKDAFDDLQTQLNKKGNPFTSEDDRVQFAIRLIGRIIFCWFLKRKDVLHDEAISSEAVKVHKQKNYYHDLLEPLFFSVLNTPENQRKGGLPKVIAHYPFLNGGLFEAQGTDYEQNLLLNIDNSWFEQLFSRTLERYNFTVDENSSSNAEIAIDPEMLGRIFENLLAEQNPETGESARKATGSFYTPREIVDYMVEQSVIEFLKTALALDEKLNVHIEDFVHTQTLPAALTNYEEKISSELSKLKVLDPACGSGAFPIGILQKVVALKQQLHPKTKNYKLKLDTIQNSIYGIDIQTMAVELSRLRCWLSLVVDEDPKDIKALPNLDFKFVCADTLSHAPVVEGLVAHTLETNLNSLEENVEQYFSPDFKNKKKIRTNIESSLGGISKYYHNLISSYITKIKQEEKSASPTRLKQLRERMMNYFQMDAKWNSYENIFKNKKVDFFSPAYFFPSAKNGFDIVIGNPPYISIASMPKETIDNLSEQNYQTFAKGADIYCLFFERGVKLLKPNAVLSYISSNRFCFTNYGVGLRRYLSEKNILQVINFNQVNVFENANVGSAVLLVQNAVPSEKPIIAYESKEKNIDSLTETIQKESQKLSRQFFNENQWSFDRNDIQALKQKIEKAGVPFVKWKNISINRGITTGLNSVFIIPESVRNEIVKADPASAEILKPVLKGANIKRYSILPPKEYLIYTYTDIDITQFPGVYSYLKKHRSELEEVYEAMHGQKKWFELRKCTYYDKFFEPKLVWTRLSNQNAFSISTNGEFTVDSSSFAVTKDAEYLAAILNSKVVFFYFKLGSVIWGKDGIKWFGSYFDNIPVPEISKERQQPFITLVNYILKIKKNGNQNSIHQSVSDNSIVKELEDIIDGMVLELYFPEEMQSKKVNIISLVEKELQKASGKNEVESIYNFYKSVSHPDSEIHNRILSFALVSPDVLKPILQG